MKTPFVFNKTNPIKKLNTEQREKLLHALFESKDKPFRGDDLVSSDYNNQTPCVQ